MKKSLAQTASGFGLIVGLACLCGCGSTVNSVERAQPVGQAQFVNDKRIITDSRLNVRARILHLNEAMTEGGLLKVQAELLNVSSSRQRFNYRFEWFDQNGMQVNTPATAALMPVVIEGKESISISSVAPTPACQDFRLKLIRAD